MANFLDTGESHDDYESKLYHLHQCPKCRHALIEMHEEITTELSKASGEIDEQRHESTQILTMPERVASDGQAEELLPDFAVTLYNTVT